MWGVPPGVIHFLLTFPFYVSPSLSLSLCGGSEDNSHKMLLAPKWNLRHKQHRAGGGLLPGAGRFALEKRIQTPKCLFALWTEEAQSLYLSDTRTHLFSEEKKEAEMKVLELLSVLVAVQWCGTFSWKLISSSQEIRKSVHPFNLLYVPYSHLSLWPPPLSIFIYYTSIYFSFETGYEFESPVIAQSIHHHLCLWPLWI